MKTRIAFFLLIGAVQFVSAAETSKVGMAGAQFLKIGVGAKYQALGEASVAIANDAYSMFWNPAGLAEVEGTDFAFTSVDWLLDVKLNYFGAAKAFEGVGVIGVSATMLSMDDIEITTFDNPDGTGEFYTATSYAIGASYARQLTTQFSFGGSIKFLGEKIHNATANGVALDFGTLLYTGFRSLRVGMSMSNVGSDMTFGGSDLDVNYDDRDGEGNNPGVTAQLKATPYDLPLLFRMGLAYDVQFGPKSLVTFAGEFKHPNDNEQQGSLGMQYGYSERFFLRAGQKINYAEEGLTLGGGLSLPFGESSKLTLDYAWQDFGRLASAQRFSVGISF